MTALIARFWPYIGLGFIASVLIAFGAGYYKGHVDTAAQIEFKTLTKTVAIKEKMDEIRNHKPDSTGVVSILRAHNF